MNNEIRWLQRFQNLEKAYSVFIRQMDEYESDPNRESFQLALTQAFEIIVELSWKTIKDYLENEGYDEVYNGKEAIRFAFQRELIHEAEVWMNALKTRNLTSHLYNSEVLHETLAFIRKQFYPALQDFFTRMKELRDSLS
ncbi:MAG: HI0074 family nucleotidyltransferase substrate-binding subunit [Caldisericia bacterium]|nr:HI0074 family nucleotidyltransferase substrate-binding subunit [Caldisericia bacterium]